MGPELALGRPIVGIANQADSGKKEDNSQDKKDDNTFYVFGAFASAHKAYRCEDEARNAQNGQNNTQYPFFHIVDFSWLSLIIKAYRPWHGNRPLFFNSFIYKTY